MPRRMSPPGRPRTLIAHEQDVIREGIMACLRASRRVTVVGAARDEAQALHLAQAVHPDIALVSTELSPAGGGRLLRALRSAAPTMNLVAVVRALTPASVADALRAGAAGVVDEGAEAGVLLDAVPAAGSGRSLLSGPMAAALIGRLGQTLPAAGSGRLTPRQRQILGLLALGLSNPDIAARLGIRPATVQLHVRQILRRLGAVSRTQAVVLGYRLGLVHLD